MNEHREGDTFGGEIVPLEQSGEVGLDGRPHIQRFRNPHDLNDIWLEVKWQHGPVPINGENGMTMEQYIEVVLMRLREYQQGETTRCRMNALAITKLEEAQDHLYRRTRERQQKQVEGTYQSHER